MTYVLQSNIPRCPVCAAFMYTRHQGDNVFYHCDDCMSLYQVACPGVTDNEVVIADTADEIKAAREMYDVYCSNRQKSECCSAGMD